MPKTKLSTETALAAPTNPAAHNAEERTRLGAAAHQWEMDTRAAFLAGYEGASQASGRASSASLMGLFELEKACYELRYELNNRVDWVQVPLHGILTLIGETPPV